MGVLKPDPNYERHNYVRKFQAMLARGELSPKVGLSHLHIFHDDWCALHTGGFCNCDPDLLLINPVPDG